MDQHPVPQPISSYEFRLVGDMTLKQFLQLSGGVVLALIFYASNLPFYIKWPLVIFFTFLGIAIAFLPIEERPLHVWIINFIKSTYSPTQYLWRKKAKKPEILEPTSFPIRPQETKAVFSDKSKLNEYLGSLPTSKNALDEKEEQVLEKMKNLFATSVLPQNLTVEARILPETFEPAGERLHKLTPPYTLPKEQLTPLQEQPLPEPRVVLQPQPGFYQRPPLRRGRPVKPQSKVAESFSEENLPAAPEYPNLLNGIVLDSNNQIVEGAIIEIKDEAGNPVRALKSNKLGHFLIATPLPSGTYEIITEKPNLAFDIYRIILKGEIIKPLIIKAKHA
jgi:hypothetical protein